ncbi:unnamed protein product [Amoebophrya sp. A120]|nr:unnamed protein product [Amoebophrya sp. A120]|eukprot:GSA120T00022115001.1
MTHFMRMRDCGSGNGGRKTKLKNKKLQALPVYRRWEILQHQLPVRNHKQECSKIKTIHKRMSVGCSTSSSSSSNETQLQLVADAQAKRDVTAYNYATKQLVTWVDDYSGEDNTSVSKMKKIKKSKKSTSTKKMKNYQEAPASTTILRSSNYNREASSAATTPERKDCNGTAFTAQTGSPGSHVFLDGGSQMKTNDHPADRKNVLRPGLATRAADVRPMVVAIAAAMWVLQLLHTLRSTLLILLAQIEHNHAVWSGSKSNGRSRRSSVGVRRNNEDGRCVLVEPSKHDPKWMRSSEIRSTRAKQIRFQIKSQQRAWVGHYFFSVVVRPCLRLVNKINFGYSHSLSSVIRHAISSVDVVAKNLEQIYWHRLPSLETGGREKFVSSHSTGGRVANSSLRRKLLLVVLFLPLWSATAAGWMMSHVPGLQVMTGCKIHRHGAVRASRSWCRIGVETCNESCAALAARDEMLKTLCVNVCRTCSFGTIGYRKKMKKNEKKRRRSKKIAQRCRDEARALSREWGELNRVTVLGRYEMKEEKNQKIKENQKTKSCDYEEDNVASGLVGVTHSHGNPKCRAASSCWYAAADSRQEEALTAPSFGPCEQSTSVPPGKQELGLHFDSDMAGADDSGGATADQKPIGNSTASPYGRSSQFAAVSSGEPVKKRHFERVTMGRAETRDATADVIIETPSEDQEAQSLRTTATTGGETRQPAFAGANDTAHPCAAASNAISVMPPWGQTIEVHQATATAGRQLAFAETDHAGLLHSATFRTSTKGGSGAHSDASTQYASGSDFDSDSDDGEQPGMEGRDPLPPVVHLGGAISVPGAFDANGMEHTSDEEEDGHSGKRGDSPNQPGGSSDGGNEGEGGHGNDEDDAPPDPDPFAGLPIREDLLSYAGHQRLRIGLVNMRSSRLGTKRFAWALRVASWRKWGVMLLDEFQYEKSSIDGESGKGDDPEPAEAAAELLGHNSDGEGENLQGGDYMQDDDELESIPDAPETGPDAVWERMEKFDIVYTNGVAIVVIVPALRKQLAKAMENRKECVRARPRMLSIYLNELVLCAFYAPTSSASKEMRQRFDMNFIANMLEMKRRKEHKWKLRIIGGDLNAQIGHEEWGMSGIHGGEGLPHTNPRGNEVGGWLRGSNAVLVGTHYPSENSATRGENELDHIITDGRFLHCFRTYGRIDMNGGGGPGKEKSPKRFDHMGIECDLDVKTHEKLKMEGIERRAAAMVIESNPSPKKLKKFNRRLGNKIREQGDSFGVPEFQDYLIESLPMFLTKKSKSPKKLPEVEELADNPQSRNEVWALFREQLANKTDRTVGITAEQSKKQLEKVGSTPLHPGLHEVPAAPAVSGVVERLSAEDLEELDKEVDFEELEEAVKSLNRGGKAKDIYGLTADILKHLDSDRTSLLCHVLNRELKGKKLSDIDKRIHRCRNMPLFKKGKRDDPDCYRFLCVSPLVLKTIVKIYTDRLYFLLEQKGFFPSTQFGFRRGMGCLDSLTIFARLREDLEHYGEEEFFRIIAILVDLRKAFPSLDSRMMEKVAEDMGLSGTICWEVLTASHRSAQHNFTSEVEKEFTLPHGCKEGCVSSPLLFLLTYTVVVRLYMKKVEEERPLDCGGVALRCLPAEFHEKRRDKIFSILTQDLGSTALKKLELAALLFADDTTLLYIASRAELEEMRQKDKERREAKPEPLPPSDCPATEILTEILHACGMRENDSKRVQEDVTEIMTRNLGMNTNNSEDIRIKINKAWRAYFGLRSKLATVQGLSNKRRGELVAVMIRTVLTYGLQCRKVEPYEIRQLELVEMQIAMRLLDIPWWMRTAGEVRSSQLRKSMRLPPLGAYINFIQAKHFGHVMRKPKGDIVRMAMTGHFFPPVTQEFDARGYMRSDADIEELDAKKRAAKKTSYVEHLVGRLRDKCFIPVNMQHLLFESVEECRARRPELEGAQSLYLQNKRAYYAATRWRFIVETLEDWDKASTPEEAEESADWLATKYFGSSTNCTRAELRKRAIDAGKSVEEAVRGYETKTGGVQGIQLAEKCLWCNMKLLEKEEAEHFEPTHPKKPPPLHLQMHLRERHQVEYHLVNEVQSEAMRQNAADDVERATSLRRDILEENSDLLCEKANNGGRYLMGRRCFVPQIHCKACGKNFTSTAGAMAKHAQDHRENKYVRLAQLIRPQAANGLAPGEFRPVYHLWDSANGRHIPGPDARMTSIHIPADRIWKNRNDETFLRCKICKSKYKKQIAESGQPICYDSHSLAKKIGMMEKHEERCAKKKMKKEKELLIDQAQSDSDSAPQEH